MLIVPEGLAVTDAFVAAPSRAGAPAPHLRFTRGFRPLPSCGPFCHVRRDKRIATPDCSWCRAGRLRSPSRARPRPATAGGLPPPSPKKSSWAGRCVRERGHSEIEADIFHARDRIL